MTARRGPITSANGILSWNSGMTKTAHPIVGMLIVVIVLTIALLNNSASSFAQSEDRLPEEAKKLDAEIASLYKVGRYADAIPLARRNLEICEKVFGPDNSDVATSLSNLALLYQKQGNFADAEPLGERSL